MSSVADGPDDVGMMMKMLELKRRQPLLMSEN